MMVQLEGPREGTRRVPLVTFLQVSDLHLGAPNGWLPPDKRDERRREQQRALEAAVSQAIERPASQWKKPCCPVPLAGQRSALLSPNPVQRLDPDQDQPGPPASP